MLELDGTDGGGQLIRTALTLSVLDGRPFRMENVRGDRAKPGLKRQHLACAEVLESLADADVSGAAVGSETLTFEPGESAERGGRIQSAPDDLFVDVGTAGSVTLVADALLPLAARSEAPVRARLRGGTDVKWSPSTDFLRRVKLPVLRECGLDAEVEVERRGFYPAGGGELAVDVRPSTLSPIALPARSDARPNASDGSEPTWTVRAVASESLEGADVADRMAEAAVSELSDRSIAEDAAPHAAYVESDSPGAAVTITVEPRADEDGAEQPPVRAGPRNPRPRAGFAAYGDRGVASEDVARDAVDSADRWRERDAPIDARLGDQLVVWLALAGGRVRVPEVTDHVRTHVDLVRAFGYDVSIEEAAGGPEATLVA